MHACSGNWEAIGRSVVYYAQASRAFSTGIKCRHCIYFLSPAVLCISMLMLYLFYMFIFSTLYVEKHTKFEYILHTSKHEKHRYKHVISVNRNRNKVTFSIGLRNRAPQIVLSLTFS